MKKFILCFSILFAFLFCGGGAVFLLSGCNSSSSRPADNNPNDEQTSGEAFTIYLDDTGSGSNYVSWDYTIFDNDLTTVKGSGTVSMGSSKTVSVLNTDFVVISYYSGSVANCFNHNGGYQIQTLVQSNSPYDLPALFTFENFYAFHPHSSRTHYAFDMFKGDRIKLKYSANGGKFATFGSDWKTDSNSYNNSDGYWGGHGVGTVFESYKYYTPSASSSFTAPLYYGMITIESGDSGPILVSKDPNRVLYSYEAGSSTRETATNYRFAMTYNGETYYVSDAFGFVKGAPGTISSSYRRTHIEGPTFEFCARKLLDTCQDYVYLDVEKSSSYVKPNNNPTRTGYTFSSWNTNPSGTGTTISTQTISSVTSSTSQTLYAQWTPKTYTLTLDSKYYATSSTTTGTAITTEAVTGAKNSSTNMPLVYLKYNTGIYTSSACSTGTEISSTNCTKPTYTGYTFGGYYTGKAGTGSKVISSSFTAYSTTALTATTTIYAYWTPNTYTIDLTKGMGSGGSDYINVTYNAVPSSITSLPTTIDGYTFEGYFTATTGGSMVFGSSGQIVKNVSGYTSSTGAWIKAANVELYARWTHYQTITVHTMVSTNGTTFSEKTLASGETYKINYKSTLYIYTKSNSVSSSITCPSSNTLYYVDYSSTISISDINIASTSNYVCLGLSTSSTSPPSKSSRTTSISISSSTYDIYVYFKYVSTNRLLWNSDDEMFYFEDGKLPQTYVGATLNSTLNSQFPVTATATYTLPASICAGQEVKVFSYTDGNKYAAVTAAKTVGSYTAGSRYFFKVEPIKWRVSDGYGFASSEYPSSWSAYGTYKTNFQVVSDKILLAGSYATTLREEQGYTNSNLHSGITALVETLKAQKLLTYGNPNGYWWAPTFNDASSQHGETGSAIFSTIVCSSESEIKLNYTDYKAQPTDFVACLLGVDSSSNCAYWTRDLGTNLDNAKMVSTSGQFKNCWVSDNLGVRLTINFTEGSRI